MVVIVVAMMVVVVVAVALQGPSAKREAKNVTLAQTQEYQ